MSKSRPTSVTSNAVRVMQIATGEVKKADDGASAAASALGKLGAAARNQTLTPERRSDIAKKAAAKRWGHD